MESYGEDGGGETTTSSQVFFADGKIGYGPRQQLVNDSQETERLHIINDRGFFGLARSAGQRNWQLRVAEPPDTPDGANKVQLPNLAMHTARAISMNRGTLYDLAIGSNAVFSEWKDNAVAGKPELTSFRVSVADEISDVTMDSRVVINRNHHGRIESHKYTVTNGARGSRELTYDDAHPLFPLTDTMKVTTASYGFSSTNRLVKLDISSPDPKLFELEHYGVKTPSFQRPYRVWIYAAVVGVGVVGIVWYLTTRQTKLPARA